jgi:alkanesulfonate monooxygenase SsuD/methylene tetrahydromethanopterin reductase-like flavin-dependent oxidoreductase (luciferase family)
MKFGAMIAPRVSDWRLAHEVEQLGYDAVWIADSHMLWSDCYAVMALAAEHTKRIEIGTGVTNPSTRLAPVTANAIATINQLAPGRTFLGIGTGFSSMAAMAAPPAKVRDFRNYLRVVRGLLHGEEVEFEFEGRTSTIRLLEPDLGFVNLDSPAAIYVAANGPKALEVAGAYGDGWIAAGERLTEAGDQMAAKRLAAIKLGAASIGRSLPSHFQSIGGAYVCILRPGETLTSDRVVNEIGALTVVGTLHAWWEMAKTASAEDFVPADCREVWERYLAHLDACGLPMEALHQRVHKGHATYLLPEERDFVTPEIILAGGAIVGEPDDIIERIRMREEGGLDQLSIMPAMENAREHLTDFRRLIIDRY